MFTHLLLTTILQDRYYYQPDFTNKKTEALRGYITAQDDRAKFRAQI